MPRRSHLSGAVNDLILGFNRRELWAALVFRELHEGTYGSFFGRFWIALSLGIFVLLVGNVYTVLFKVEAKTYLPFLCSGLVCWRFITNIIIESAIVFVKSESCLKGFSLPVSVFVYRSLYKNLIIFTQYLLVYLLVALYYSVDFTLDTLWLIPGILVVALNGFWFMIASGLICTRFRDMAQLLNSLMLLVFFITPIFWPKEMVESHTYLVQLNPFYHVLEVIRAPLLGLAPTPLSWAVGLGLGVFGTLAVLPFFARFRSRIVYWV